jgi:hypothetical protein
MCVGLPFFRVLKPFLEGMVLDSCVQFAVHFSPMLLLDCPICMILAPTLPLATLEPKYTHAMHKQARESIDTSRVLLGSDTGIARPAGGLN